MTPTRSKSASDTGVTSGGGERSAGLPRQAAPPAYRALTGTAEAPRTAAASAGLDRARVELVSVRVSQLHACACCLGPHTRAALRAGEATRRPGASAARRDTGLCADQERTAFAPAEATAPGRHGPPERRVRAGAGCARERGDLRRDPGGDHHQRLRLSVFSEHPVRPAVPGRGVTPSRADMPPVRVPARLEGGGVARARGAGESEGRAAPLTRVVE